MLLWGDIFILLRMTDKINLGLSGSIGGEVSVSKTLGLTVRGSYHGIFEGQKSNNFYTIQGGVRVKL